MHFNVKTTQWLTVSSAFQLVHFMVTNLVIHSCSSITEVKLQNGQVVFVLNLSFICLIQFRVTVTKGLVPSTTNLCKPTFTLPWPRGRPAPVVHGLEGSTHPPTPVWESWCLIWRIYRINIHKFISNVEKKVEIEELDFLIDIEKWRRNRPNLDSDLGTYSVY